MGPRPGPRRSRGPPLTGDRGRGRLTTPAPIGLPVELRRATAADLPALVALLADDPLGATREATDGDLSPYRRAFELLDDDPAHVLVVAVDGTPSSGRCS